MKTDRKKENGPTLAFSMAEYKRRHRKIRELMELRGIDCLVIGGHTGVNGSAAADVRYVSGVFGAFDGPYILFPLIGDPVVVAHSESGVFWASKVSPIPVEVVSFKKGTRIRDYAADLARRIKDLGLEGGRIGLVTMRVIPAYIYAGLLKGLPEAEFLSAGDVLLEARRIKSPEEIEAARKAGQITDKGMEAIIAAARPGASERDLIGACESALYQAGADRGSFILLRSGPWTEMQGTISTGGDRRLQKNDLIFTELSPSYKGYYTQLCCPIFLGKRPPADFMELLATDKALHDCALAMLKPGNTVNQIEAEVARLAGSRGDFRRAWALQSAELAEAFFKQDTELQPGMCYVNHPWTEFRSGKGYQGHTVGATYLVRQEGPDALNRTSLDLRCV